MMPLTECVSFKAVIQRNNRIQIPVLIRWRFKLEPSEVFRVEVRLGFHREEFYACMTKDGRLTIPKTISDVFLEDFDRDNEEESLNGYTVKVELYPAQPAQEEEEDE